MAPVVAILRESSATETMEELGSEFSKHNIFLKVMEDTQFDVLFHQGTEDLEINIDDDTFLFIAKKAHEEDITFNQMFNKILVEQIEKEKTKWES